MKRCGVCRTSYRGAGKRVVADGRFRVACPACAGRAVRVAQSIVLPGCACGEGASLCRGCATRAEESARSNALDPAVRKLRAYMTAFKGTVPQEDERRYIEGVADGLERALDMLLGRGA